MLFNDTKANIWSRVMYIHINKNIWHKDKIHINMYNRVVPNLQTPVSYQIPPDLPAKLNFPFALAVQQGWQAACVALLVIQGLSSLISRKTL